MTKPIIFWFRQDLRAYDLPGLSAAIATGQPVIACYILDDNSPGDWTLGGASRWWLHHSLQSLAKDVDSLGGRLILRRGEPLNVLTHLLQETGADAIYCTRQYEPWASQLESTLFEALETQGVTFKRYPGSLLFEPGRVMNKSGRPFQVFTPFWRHCRNAAEPVPPQASPEAGNWHKQALSSDSLDDWHLCPSKPDWAHNWHTLWQPGTDRARLKLQSFLKDGVKNYSEGRDHPAHDSTTRLSPHLHFGELSPRELWHEARQLAAREPALQDQTDKLLSELGWREFSHHLMHHFPTLPEQPFKSKFNEFPWQGSPATLSAWQRGQTGYPIVDAGMRELWQTGFMHNRVRMIVASFLTKHLLIHWRAGARWFWDTLLDADLANNSSGWQWVAGSGADASPYFRIFNPIIQGEKFDKEGAYIRQWVPELAGLPDRYLNKPWEAPTGILQESGIALGKDYPLPIVDHKAARESALSAFASLPAAVCRP